MENYNLETFDKAILEGSAAWWEMELPSGQVIFSDSKTSMLGYKYKDFKNYKDFTNIVHPDDHDKIMQDMRDHLDGKKELYETKYRIKNKDGEYLTFYDIGQIISKTENNIKLIGFVWKIEENTDINNEMKEFRNLILKGNPSLIDLFKKFK
ncbi:PAS domain S-box protein [Candidatus Parcubacteria bacterium]|nr:MAG: PAS domain S-box protein [Candidatus Parcubacteria bacterium]